VPVPHARWPRHGGSFWQSIGTEDHHIAGLQLFQQLRLGDAWQGPKRKPLAWGLQLLHGSLTAQKHRHLTGIDQAQPCTGEAGRRLHRRQGTGHKWT
jgi:hypothetical protein